MKQTAHKSAMVKGVIALGLSMIFITYPVVRTSASTTIHAAPAAKSEAQFKDEASRYERALLAISRISSAKLDTPEALQEAIELFKSQRTNINFHRSKLVVKATSDPNFAAAVKRVANNAKSAERLLKELSADPNRVLKLDGAKTLIAALDQSSGADAAILQQVGEKLKAAADKIKESNTDRGALLPSSTGYSFIKTKFDEPSLPVMPSHHAVMVDPVTVIAIVAIAAAVVVTTVFVATAIKNLYENLFTEDGRDAVTQCQRQADDRLAVCLRSAGRLSFFLKLAAEGLCASQWALDQAQCLVKA